VALALLELQGVAKHYQRGREDVVALSGIDLEVAAGELVALIGPSGSGKSTLLHLAGGLDVPDAGTVRVGGRDLADLSVVERARLRRRDVGFVFQFFHLLPTLNVFENVELPLLLDRRRGRAERVRTLLERVGLTHRVDHLPGELSGGEMQRAAIARALVAEPQLLLADEPTGNLDSATGAEVLRLLTEVVAEAGTALVMVTHDDGAAAKAGRVLRLLDGHLVAGPGDGSRGDGSGGSGGEGSDGDASRGDASRGDGAPVDQPTAAAESAEGQEASSGDSRGGDGR
jgi:ABC-type lipoprotein export system ATPase subunit